MSYLALARKYRPQDFDTIVGQDHVVRTLKNAISTGRIHHAYLFTGIRGVGKTTAARVLAKALNCEQGPRPDPCGVCRSCLEITKGSSMDVLELDAASNRGIDAIRDLCETVRYSTARDRYRVVIIDEVHMLTDQAFNALLKTLEEPPPHVRFVLATTDPQKLPATILSRCQRLDFKRVEPRDLLKHLQEISAKEDMTCEEEALRVIIRESGGSVRDSMSLLDQLLASSGGNLTLAGVEEILGLANHGAVLGMVKTILAGEAEPALTILRDQYLSGHDLKTFFMDLMQAFRDLLVLRLSPGEGLSLVDRSSSEASRLTELGASRGLLDLNSMFKTVLDGIQAISASDTPRFAAEELVIRLCLIRKSQDLDTLFKRLKGLEERLGAAGATSPLAPAAASPAPSPKAELPAPTAAPMAPSPRVEPIPPQAEEAVPPPTDMPPWAEAAAPAPQPAPPSLPPAPEAPTPAVVAPAASILDEISVELDDIDEGLDAGSAELAPEALEEVAEPVRELPSFAALEEIAEDLNFLNWVFDRQPSLAGLLSNATLTFDAGAKTLTVVHPKGQQEYYPAKPLTELLTAYRDDSWTLGLEDGAEAGQTKGSVQARLKAQAVRKRQERVQRVKDSALLAALVGSLEGAKVEIQIND